MKDIIIGAKRIKTELLTFLACFVIANLLNLYSIIAYKTAYVELLTQIFYVLLFSVALYIVWTIIRIIYFTSKKLFKSKK